MEAPGGVKPRGTQAVVVLPKPETTWVEAGQELKKQRERLEQEENSWRWRVADWLLTGEKRKISETYEKAAKIVGRKASTLKNWAVAARRFPKSRRRDELSIYYHVAVTSLTPDEADGLLAQAVERKWSISKLTAEARAAQGLPALAPSKVPHKAQPATASEAADCATTSSGVDSAPRPLPLCTPADGQVPAPGFDNVYYEAADAAYRKFRQGPPKPVQHIPILSPPDVTKPADAATTSAGAAQQKPRMMNEEGHRVVLRMVAELERYLSYDNIFDDDTRREVIGTLYLRLDTQIRAYAARMGGESTTSS